MNLLTRVRRALTPARKSLSNPTALENKLLGIRPASAGITVTPRIAMECTTVRACVEVIAETVGQLPLLIYKKGKDGAKQRDSESPLYAVLHDAATDWLSAEEFREVVTRDALMYGNGYAYIEREADTPSALIRLDPCKVEVDAHDDGEPFYTYTNDGTKTVYAFMDILHIRAPSFDGYVGASPIALAKEAIALALVLERYGGTLFKNSAQPGGVIQHPQRLGDDTVERLTNSWNEAHGGENAGGVAILEEGAVYQKVGMTSTDAQYLELRKFSVEEICRVFRVPPIFVGDYGRATWSNGEQQGTQLVTYCLLPWLKRWEAEVNLKLVSKEDRKKVFAEFLIDALLRADTAARYASYAQAIAARFLNPNEARAAENLPPYSGGEKFENPNTSTPTPAPSPEKVAA